MTWSSEPKVAVIIPTYNRWPHVGDAIDSVLGQSYKRMECIVVDDASSDDSSRRIQEKYGDSVIVISNPENMEKSFCRNLGVKPCDAKYVCFLDSDDLLTEDSVRKDLKLFRRRSLLTGFPMG